MFGRWIKSTPSIQAPEGAEQLEVAVRQELRQADAETVLVVTAIAGLLGTVAYADREYSSDEEARIRRELSRVHGMTEAGISAICAVLRKHIIEVSTVQAPRYSRILRDLADRELRVDVLDLIVELAAADGAIANVESNVLRQITTALGLTQDDYNAAQQKHRDLLAVLR